MIKGAKNWNNRKKVYRIQNNNLFEILKDGLWFCGPTSGAIAHDAVDSSIEKNPYGGDWLIQKEDYISSCFLTEVNWKEFKKIRKLNLKKYPPYTVPQYYPWVIKKVFGREASFHWGGTYEKITKLVWDGNAVQICLKEPGHYIVAVAYNDETGELIYHDPWPDRHPDRDGFAKRMSQDEFKRNVEDYYILYHKD